MSRLALTGRILFLAADPRCIDHQLAGEDLSREEAGALRHEVSTDEITPMRVLTYCDQCLGRYPYVGA